MLLKQIVPLKQWFPITVLALIQITSSLRESAIKMVPTQCLLLPIP